MMRINFIDRWIFSEIGTSLFSAISRYYLLFFSLLTLLNCNKEQPLEKWAQWTVYDKPVFKGQFPLNGDPSVIKDGEKYRMFYTGFDAYRTPQGPEICQAVSDDGTIWTNVSVNDPIEGRMLNTTSNTWSSAHETSFALTFNNSYYLYFIGYKDNGGFFNSDPIGLGLVTATNGKDFLAAMPDPIMESTPDGLDRDGISSPSITHYENEMVMIYSGFCYTDCGTSNVTHLLSATSTDGIHWKKTNSPIISTTEIPWASKGVAESEMVLGPDNLYYLFMTSINEPHVIGLATSETPFGPWEVNPEPIIKADKSFSGRGAVAPSVLIENNRVRLWYSGFNADEIYIGYAETEWPLKN